MKYRTSNPTEAKEAAEFLNMLIEKGAIVTVKRHFPTRTLKQNAYLHLIIGFFGLHFGYTLEEAKQIYKEINRDIYAYDKKRRTFWRSSAQLTTEEMAKTIDKFRLVSAEAGCELPLATDQDALLYIENLIEREGYYL